MQIKFITHTSHHTPNMLRKIITAIVTLTLAIIALMFSAVMLTILLIIAVIGGAYLWWKTRTMRKQLLAQMQGFPPPGTRTHSKATYGETFDGEIIEGEVVRVHEPSENLDSADRRQY